MFSSSMKWPAYGVMMVAYLLLKMQITLNHTIDMSKDSYSYMSWPSWRSFTLPVIYHLIGDQPYKIIDFQWVFSAIAWLLLAFTLVWVLRPFIVGLITGLLTLLFSLSHFILQWDMAVLSESMSISFLVLLAAVLIMWYRQYRLGAIRIGIGFFIIPIVPVLVLFSNTRDSNLYLLLLLAPLLLIVFWSKRKPKATYALFVVLILVSTIGTYLAQSHDENKHQRWVMPLEHVVFDRVLTDPTALAYFEKAGMPVTPDIIAHKGQPKTKFTTPDLKKLETWIKARGKTTYMRYMITHLIPTTHTILTHMPDVYNTGAIEKYYGNVGLHPLAKWLDERFFFQIKHPLRWILALGIIPLLLLAVSRKHWRVTAVHTAILLAALTQTYIGYMGDSIETVRHCLLGDIFFRVSIYTSLLTVFYTIYPFFIKKGTKEG